MLSNQTTTKVLIVLLSLFLFAGCGIFGSSAEETPRERPTPPRGASANDEIKPFNDVIKDTFDKDEGLFTVYEDDGTFYYEIPDSLLGREMLMVSRIARTADGIGYGGERLSNQILRWERRQDDILLRRVSFQNTASDTLPIYEAVRNSNFEPIIMSFNIEALNEDSTGTVIDVTKLFETDVPALGLQQNRRTSYQVRVLMEAEAILSTCEVSPRILKRVTCLPMRPDAPLQIQQPVLFRSKLITV